MADGRQIDFMKYTLLSDEVVKLHQANDRIVYAQFGMSVSAFKDAPPLVHTLLNNSNDPHTILSEFERVSLLERDRLLERKDLSDEQQKKLRVGFLFGGLLPNDSPFIGCYLWTPNGRSSRPVCTISGSSLVVGGDEESTPNLFVYTLREYIADISHPTSKACIIAGASTIREVSKTHCDVGGKITYSVIKRGQPIQWGNM